ncbi:MAG: glycosyltransferase, partial [Candidatus Eremiobacteraeota bacterium]|nr:glycosyltransferase [Candidatus Eremiobacteraeota bacterium]
MKRWRIGLFTECYRPIQNGIVASVDALAQTLCARGHDTAIVTPRMPGFDDDARNVVRLPSLPLPTRTAYRLTVPYLRASDGFSLVHAHSPFMTGALAAWYAHRRRVPLVFTYHTQLEAYAHYVPFEAHTTRAATALLTRTYANAADIVIVPTRAMELHLRTLGVEREIAVIPSGIDVAAFARGRRSTTLRERLGVAPHERMVLAVGRLEREKNFELALETFARAGISEARLVLVGDGTHRAALERFAAQAGIAASVTFAREFARDDLPDAYASADAFLFTSRSETQGLVLVEALAAGVPIVALDTPQTRDVLGGAGTLVEGNAAACAAAL